ncbi:MAG: peptide chain release factor 3, partial [Nitrospiraceae bacterium]
MSLPSEKSLSDELAREVARRRTFAIISHPDAGKTTLTEKLLLYAGAVHLAGAVHARSHQRASKSDWMELEQARGISITSTALQFDYQGVRVNLLDTPGHQDFSEDTYRTLMAVDSAVMVLDCAKGIEPQTKKLFAVCRKRNIPIMTFINKMDLPGRHPYELLEEIEHTLGMTAVPFNWPIGEGAGFQGLYDLQEPQVLFFQRTLHNQRRAPMKVEVFPHPSLAETLGEAYGPLQEEIALLTGAGTTFDRDRFLAGQLTPVFFGSALTNFGVEPFLNGFLKLAPPPGPRMSSEGLLYPTDEQFSGFVFKIQANMDPQHRDRMAFLRIVSGRFEKDMMVYHSRLDRKIRMTRPHRLFGRDRETIE